MSNYNEYEMQLNGFEEKMAFLNEIKEKYGDISLEEALKKLSEENIPLSECKFTGILVHNYQAYESAGEYREFTKTLLQVIKDITYFTLDELEEEEIETLVQLFTSNDWVTLGSEEDTEVKLVSIDRKVTEDEIREYLRDLKLLKALHILN